jgi:hypothetical protein
MGPDRMGSTYHPGVRTNLHLLSKSSVFPQSGDSKSVGLTIKWQLIAGLWGGGGIKELRMYVCMCVRTILYVTFT